MATKTANRPAYKIEEIPANTGSASKRWEVKTTSIYVQGYIEQFRPEAQTVHPFKAFARPHARAPFKMVGVFYAFEHGGSEKAKQKAVSAILSCTM